MEDGRELNPSQQETLDRLRAGPADRPTFDPDLRDRLRRTLEEELSGPATAVPDGDKVHVSKHALAGVHGCEARWKAEDDQPFEASVPVVVGSVAHKAIELSLNLPTAVEPAELVDRALARLAGSERWM
ncbi:MAG TPA: hypothetical protein VK507_14505, partial [Iamia sp.]|nr:hypothetical protein [Iamia sp.]